MAIDPTKLDDDGLNNLIRNHLKLRATDRPLYEAAVAEYNRRLGGRLKLDTSIAYLRKAAAERRFVSYGELAEANGAVWDQVRYPMFSHLWAIICHAKARDWPMLSAIVVNKEHVASGDMEPSTLAGFVKAANDLGHVVENEDEFLKAQQEACFRWGARADAVGQS